MVKKTRTTILRNASKKPLDDFVPGTPAERIAMVWPLTCEAASIGNKYDVEQRLQRHITVLGRRKH